MNKFTLATRCEANVISWPISKFACFLGTDSACASFDHLGAFSSL